MNFTYKGANLGRTIKKCEVNRDSYDVEYLDGSTSHIYAEASIEKLKERMIQQAVERDIEMSKSSELNTSQKCFIIAMILETLALVLERVSSNRMSFLIFYLSIIALYSTCLFDITYKKRELQKYKLFLEMLDDLDKINESKFLECIMPEKMYQTQVNIITLDSIPYKDIKILYKKYKKEIKNREQ